MPNFTPWPALAGGALIGFAAALLLWLNGRIAGISGIVNGAMNGPRGDTAWRGSDRDGEDLRPRCSRDRKSDFRALPFTNLANP